ncbi:MAG: hypothetical protein H0W28_07540 [Pyrinomonadaceae bacterium]|nr:hypothetical protein [Pyrinomonadaceae bacterium]
MKIGDLNHWAVHKLNARIDEVSAELEYAQDAVGGLYQNLEDYEVEEASTQLFHLQSALEVLADDIDYICNRLEVERKSLEGDEIEAKSDPA